MRSCAAAGLVEQRLGARARRRVDRIHCVARGAAGSGQAARAAAQREHQPGQPGDEQHERARPEQHGGGLHRRTVEHEVAVARDQVVDDLLVAAAGLDLLAHLVAQVDGELRVRVGERLVLAHQAAQHGGQVHDARLDRGILGERRRFAHLRVQRRRGGERRAREQGGERRPHPLSCFTSGRILSRTVSGVTGPIFL